ncbi:MAG: tetraacyldisaccharide 4'-kinase, partial [Bacteroidetes bacterium]|nr:tetraacyldisaccharide 4'-kinase [Bacteroidota bacterium]
QFLRFLLLPFSLIYGTIMWIRNFLYDHKILNSKTFRIPVIGVGNLNTGGTGKTPHVEYLVRLLKGEFKVATLSRGYGRKTSGFILVTDPATTTSIGDEPMQYHSKFKDIMVSVGEDRVAAIENLLHTVNKPEVVLLDDAYQHRTVKAGINILLFEYDKVMDTDYPLPAGNLREWKPGMKRADIIIITKSPSILVPIERKRILERLKPRPHQQVYFSHYRYGEFVKITGKQGSMFMSSSYYLEKRFTILVVTGIANPSGLIEYLRRHTDKLEIMTFPDHHNFSLRDIKKIQETFDNIANASKIIVTTEKDAMRFRNPELEEGIRPLPLFYLPIEVAFHNEKEKFDQFISDYVRKNQPHRLVHQATNQFPT